MNKYKKILDWLQDYNLTFKWIDFNVTPLDVGQMSVNSVSNQREIETYIDGTRLVELMFAIDLVCDYDTGTSETNLNAIQEFNDISDWIETQNEEGNFPDIDGLVEEVVALQLAPTLTISEDMSKAKYQGQFKITYMEE